MSLDADTAPSDSISKAEFARRRGVSPGRVSQWLAEGKITGAAIDGIGRDAKIRESVAVAQLKRKLDPMQMTGNGLGTNLSAPPAAAQSDLLPIASPATQPEPDSIEDKIKLQRLQQIERTNREAQRQEAVAAGRLTDASLARAAAGRETNQLLTKFEGALADFATAVSAEFKLPQRDVLHVLRAQYREMRSSLAAAARARAAELPPTMTVEIDDSRDPATDAEQD